MSQSTSGAADDVLRIITEAQEAGANKERPIIGVTTGEFAKRKGWGRDRARACLSQLVDDGLLDPVMAPRPNRWGQWRNTHVYVPAKEAK